MCAAWERSHREMGYLARHQVVALSPPPAPTSLALGGPTGPAPGMYVAPARSTGCPVHAGEPFSVFCQQGNAATTCRHCCLLDDPTHRRSVLNGAATEMPPPALNGSADLGGLSYLEKVAETEAVQLRVAAKNAENAPKSKVARCRKMGKAGTGWPKKSKPLSRIIIKSY